MLEALQKLELMALSLSYELLIVAGAVILGGGLCVWLGGLSWRIITSGFFGILTGFAGSLFVNEELRMPAFFVGAAAGASFILLFKKRGLVFAGAAMIAVIGMFLFSAQAINQSGGWENPDWPLSVESGQKLSPDYSCVILISQVYFFGNNIVSAMKDISIAGIAVCSVAALIFLSAGLFFNRIYSSIATATLGTVFVYAGMIVLLLQKGSMPFTSIYQNTVFYQTVAICMIAFGTVAGLFLCPSKKIISNSEKNEDGE